MLVTDQFKVNSNINRTTGKAPFDLILRFRPEMRMNIEVTEIENSHNTLKKAPAARREIELKEKNANLVRNMWDISQAIAKKYYNTYKVRPAQFTLSGEESCVNFTIDSMNFWSLK
jgi:hypothetical protein